MATNIITADGFSWTKVNETAKNYWNKGIEDLEKHLSRNRNVCVETALACSISKADVESIALDLKKNPTTSLVDYVLRNYDDSSSEIWSVQVEDLIYQYLNVMS